MDVTLIMPKTTTRNLIFDYLEQHPFSSSDDLSRRFSISGATARHHLLLLVEEGRITIASNKVKNNRGRPFQTYQVVDKLSLVNLAQALIVLINHLEPNVPLLDALIKCQIDRMKIGLNHKYSNLTLQLIHLVEQLNKIGYHARWEVHRSSPQLIFENCPFSTVNNREKLFCPMDVRMLQQILGHNIQQVKRFEMSESGQRVCRFILDQSVK